MSRAALAAAAAVIVASLVASPAPANHNADVHSENLELIATFDADGEFRTGTDIAFWGDRAVLGNYNNPGGFRLLDISDPANPQQIVQFACPGTQNDVSIWEDLVFLSVDATRAGPECDAGGAAQADVLQGNHWEGIRIVSIANPAEPVYLTAVDTDCGSHTHTLVPDEANDRLLVYVLSYPLGGQGSECNAASHRKISVVEVPLDDPASAEVIGTPSVSPAVGCHDVSVLLEQQLAAAACITETQLWDISDPAEPQIVAQIRNPLINIHHSSAFSFDGETLVIGDELGGAAVTPGCLTDGNAPLGALWFYDVSDPASPAERGSFVVPRTEAGIFCTAHNFNVVPLTDDRDILVSAWYNGGTTVIDFTDPANPTELAHYVAADGGQSATWSSYWYNGYIYANNFDEDVNSISGHSRGFDILRLTEAEIQARAVELPHLNAQVQEPFPVATTTGDDGASDGGGAQVRGTREVLPATGASAWYAAGVILLGVGFGTARWLRRG